MDRELVAALGDAVGARVLTTAPVRGGDTARAYRVGLADGRTIFAKSHAAAPEGFFTTEATGLRWLAEAGAVRTPEVLAVGTAPAFLALEWIEVGHPDPGTDARFGRALAALHRSGAPSFGREDGRPTGSRSLPNEPSPTWAEFYRERRLLPLAEMAETTDALDRRDSERLRRVAGRLEELVGPPEPPARLHGDLWAGNRLVDRTGESWIVDPACFGGHREFDLAMMQLFGGFGIEAFDAYDTVFPIAPGWKDRVSLHQLAPLVVHAIKFGGGYVGAAVAAIDQYS